MNVSELIELLKTFPQEAPVCYCLYSEQCLLEKHDLGLKKLQFPRTDGWIHDERPDKPSIEYLVFPGN